MLKYGSLFLGLMIATHTFAHEPYLAPLSYQTTNSQVAVLAGYSEEALVSEFALKDAHFAVIDPKQNKTQIEFKSQLKSLSAADLSLPTPGTYLIESQIRYPLSYVKDGKEWKLFFEAPLEKAGEKSKRDYRIPADFKSNHYAIEKITREWTVQSYLTKGDQVTTPVVSNLAPIQVTFSQHPNLFKAQQPVTLNIQYLKNALADAKIHVRYKNATDEQAVEYKSDKQGQAVITFASAGEYIIEVTQDQPATQKPQDQFYTIISVMVHAS